jgi:hypothetical protein
MLKQLTPLENKIPNISTFAFPDKNPGPILPDVEKQQKVFPDARNFK